MQILFLQTHKRLIKKLFDSNIIQPVHKYGQQIYYRLPIDEFKTMIKIPCPVSNPKQQQNIVQSSKRLRAFNNLQQQLFCQSCQNKYRCPFFSIKQQPKQNQAVNDLVNWLNALSVQQNQQYHYRIWLSSLKVMDAFGELLVDLKEGGKQFQIFNYQRLKMFEQKLKQQQRNKQNEQNLKTNQKKVKQQEQQQKKKKQEKKQQRQQKRKQIKRQVKREAQKRRMNQKRQQIKQVQQQAEKQSLDSLNSRYNEKKNKVMSKLNNIGSEKRKKQQKSKPKYLEDKTKQKSKIKKPNKEKSNQKFSSK